MQKGVIYWGELNEDLNDVLPKVIEEANETNKTVCLQWNGVVVKVMPRTSVQYCMNMYEEEQKKRSVYDDFIHGKIVSCEGLGKKIANFLMEL